MPVRKIPKSYLFVTGGYSSQKNKEMDGFESLLEKEYLLLLDFDATVASFETQPVRIPVSGVANGYVPDVLVKFRPVPESGELLSPRLVEVKHTDDLKKNEIKYAKKFAAAHQYAEQHGWTFEVVNQTQIRTPRLTNLKFLREYRNVEPLESDVKQVLTKMKRLTEPTTSNNLLAALAQTDDESLYWLPVIWHMVLNKQLMVDLDQLFKNDVPLWLPGALP